MNYHWPETQQNGFFPWYRILWNSLWIIPSYVFLFCFCLVVTLLHLNLVIGIQTWKKNQ